MIRHIPVTNSSPSRQVSKLPVDLWSVNLAKRASLRVNGYFWEDCTERALQMRDMSKIIDLLAPKQIGYTLLRPNENTSSEKIQNKKSEFEPTLIFRILFTEWASTFRKSLGKPRVLGSRPQPDTSKLRVHASSCSSLSWS